MANSYIIGAARTPRGRGKIDKGALSGVHPQELFGQVLNTLQQRLGFDAREVDDVIAGCVSQVGEQGANVARNAVLAAGWPYEVSTVSARQGFKRFTSALWALRRARWTSPSQAASKACPVSPWDPTPAARTAT